MNKKLLTLISAFLFGGSAVQAQCITTTAYGSATINACPGGPTNITTCNYKGEYSQLTFNMTGVFSFGATGGTTQNYLTLTDASNAVIAFGNAPLQATIATTGNYRLHISEWDPLESTCRHASLSIL